MASEVEQVRLAANRVNNSLMDYIMSLPDEAKPAQQQITAGPAKDSTAAERRDSNFGVKAGRSSTRESTVDLKAAEAKAQEPKGVPTVSIIPDPNDETSPEPHPGADLDYEVAVNALTLQFLNEHEATRVAALSWLIMLHKKAPRKVMCTTCHVWTTSDCP